MKNSDTEGLYQSLFDNLLDGLAYCKMEFDGEGNPVDFTYIKVNRRFEELTGMVGVEGKRISQIIPGIRSSNSESFEIYGRVSMTGVSQQFETYVEQLDRWFSISAYSPERGYFMAVFQNITDTKRIEKNLENERIAAQNVLEDLSAEKSKVEAAQAREEAILLSVGDGLIVTNKNGVIELINATAQQLLGKKTNEVMGKVISEALSIEDENGDPIQHSKRPVSMALSSRTTTSSSTTGPMYYYIRKDKTRFPVAIIVTPVVLSGKVVGTIEVFRDISREKEIDRAKTEFVSLASHQLRTPLSEVNWYTEMLLAGDAGTLTPQQKKYLTQVYSSNQRMVALVNALLNVSRLEIGTFLIEPEPTNVLKLLQSVVDEQKPQVEDREITLTVTAEPNVPILSADPKLLRVILQNLLSNAVKYTPIHGTVTIGLILVKQGSVLGSETVHEDSVAITVSDTGYGIPEGQRGKIFTKLFRADNVREKDTEGTGLGLYIVKSILDHSGGTVWFDSVENTGSTFYVTIPVSGMKKKAGTKVLE